MYIATQTVRKSKQMKTQTVALDSSSEPPIPELEGEPPQESARLSHTCRKNTCKNEENLQKSYLHVRQARFS